jgi:hypothetical protein
MEGKCKRCAKWELGRIASISTATCAGFAQIHPSDCAAFARSQPLSSITPYTKKTNPQPRKKNTSNDSNHNRAANRTHHLVLPGGFKRQGYQAGPAVELLMALEQLTKTVKGMKAERTRIV